MSKIYDFLKFAICVAVGHKNTEKAPHEFDFDKSVSFV